MADGASEKKKGGWGMWLVPGIIGLVEIGMYHSGILNMIYPGVKTTGIGTDGKPTPNGISPVSQNGPH